MHRYICRKKVGAQQQQKQQQQQHQMQMQQPKLLSSPEKVVAKLKISSPPIFLQQVEEEAKVEKDIHVFDFDLVIPQKTFLFSFPSNIKLLYKFYILSLDL